MPTAAARWRASRLIPFRVVEQSADRADELARAAEVRNGEGFRMPARRDYPRAL